MIWFAPLLVTTALFACSASERTAPLAVSIAPMRELSGLAILSHEGKEILLAVGDESYDLLLMPLGDGLAAPDPARARTIPLALPRRPDGSELEGVAVAADGRVAVLSEPGVIVFLTLDREAATSRIDTTLPIVFAANHPLKSAWDADTNARAEGLAFLGERTFIVKQKDPVALIELVRVGDSFEARDHWALELGDATDLALHDGALWVIGGRANTLCRLGVPKAGAPLPCTLTTALPDGLEGKSARWEGLAVRKDGSLVLGADVKKDRPNLAILPAPRAAP